jgi:hypothetical protein
MSYVCMYLKIFNSQLKFRCQTTDSSNQLELRTYTEVVPFKEKSSFHFVVLGEILNGMEYKLGIEFKYI